MAIDKLTPRYLNKDSDEKVLQSVEFADANNFRVATDKDGNGGIIKNIKGNSSITLDTTLPVGQNRVVGTYSFDAVNKVYIFLYNNLDNHCIYEYDTNSSEVVLLMQEAALEFRNDDYLNIDGVIYDDEVYLYFTDGRSNPKKISVTKAKLGGYPAGSTIAEKQIELNVVKKQPSTPFCEFQTDYSIDSNDLIGLSFQFAAQYVYRDKEESALGAYSPLVASPNTLNATSSSDGYRKLYNKLQVSVEGSTDAVEKVRLYVRKNSSMPFYLVEEKDNDTTVVFEFYNNKLGELLASNDSNKLQDSVPLTAKAQTISAGRLVYGNYTEGFDVGSVSANITVNYDNEYVPKAIPAALKTSWQSSRMVLRFDLSNIANVPSLGGTVLFDVLVSKINSIENVSRLREIYQGTTLIASQSVYTKFSVAGFDYSAPIEVPASANRAAFAASFGSGIVSGFQNIQLPVKTDELSYATRIVSGTSTYDVYYGGQVTFSATASTYTASATSAPFLGKPVLDIEFKMDEYDLISSEVILDPNGYNLPEPTYQSTAYQDNSSANPIITGTTSVTTDNSGLVDDNTYLYDSQGEQSFKTGKNHSFGVVYQDKYGRTSGVQQLGDVYVRRKSERFGNDLGSAHVNIQLTSSRPTWADKFFFVYGGNGQEFLQYQITEAFYVAGDGDRIHLALRGLQGAPNSYVDSDGSKTQYQFSEGDRLRVISYKNTTGGTVYPDGIDFKVVGLVTYEDTASSPIIPEGGATADKDARKVGDFILIDSPTINGFSQPDVAGNLDLWANECLVEIYNKQAEIEPSVYYAIGDVYDAASQHTATHQIEGGDIWYKPRTIIGFEWATAAKTNGLINADTEEMDTFVRFIESSRYYDFKEDTKYYTKGKPYGVIPGEKKQNRYSSVTYSEPLAQDSPFNTLSSFNNGLANWYDFEANSGGIYGLVDKSNYIVLIQEDAVGFSPVNRNIIDGGTEFIGLSTDFINQPTYMPTTCGIQDRGAFVDTNEDVVFFDVQRGAVYSIGAKGLANISNNGLKKYFSTEARILTDFSDRVVGNSGTYEGSKTRHIRMGFDPYHGEVTISYHTLSVGASPIGGIYPFTTDYDFKSAVYSTSAGAWTHLSDVNADGYAAMNNSYFHVKNVGTANLLYEAEANPQYAEFFGTQYSSGFTIISNRPRSGVKTFTALSIEGNAPADVTFSTLSQSSSLVAEVMTKKEDEYFSPIPRSDSGNDEWMAIGIVSSINGNTVSFTNAVNRLPLTIGGSLWRLDSSGNLIDMSATLSGISGKNSIVVSDASLINLDYTLVVKANSKIDGDPMRGHWLKAEFNFDNTTEQIEIFGVNVNYSDSTLHNVSGISGVEQQ